MQNGFSIALYLSMYLTPKPQHPSLIATFLIATFKRFCKTKSSTVSHKKNVLNNDFMMS